MGSPLSFTYCLYSLTLAEVGRCGKLTQNASASFVTCDKVTQSYQNLTVRPV